MELSLQIIHTLSEYGILYKRYFHGPILTYEDAEREKAIHHWSWVESKNVFLTDKNGSYFLFVTVQWEKVDFQRMKELTGKKLSIASREDVTLYSWCVPWCVAPLLFDESIKTIVDSKIFQHEKYLFSPGVSTETLEIDPKWLRKVFESQKNIIFME